MIDPVTIPSRDQARPALPPPRLVNAWAVIGLCLAVVLIYGRYLTKNHFTATCDFPQQ